jgi:putative transposase
MPNRRPIYIPDVSHHVFPRGLNRCNIVSDDGDRDRLLNLIAGATGRHGVKVHCFAVMTTHYHLVVTPNAKGALAKAMQQIGIRYTRYFNRKYRRMGTIWNERYGAAVIEDNDHWYRCLRYVELNPLEAHMVTTLDEYRWSSYRVHAFGASCDWLTPHPLYDALGPTSQARQAAYRAMCAAPLTEIELELPRHPKPRVSQDLVDVSL